MDADDSTLLNEILERVAVHFEKIAPEQPTGISREVLVDMVARAIWSRLKRGHICRGELDNQIRVLISLLADEAPASPLEAKQIILMLTLDEAIDQQLTSAVDVQQPDIHSEWRLSFVNRASDVCTRQMDQRDRRAARRQIDRKKGRLSGIAEAVREGNRRVAKAGEELRIEAGGAQSPANDETVKRDEGQRRTEE